MKCEYCYHGKVCKGSGIEIVADGCHHFVEATKMIELPCKVGDVVYIFGEKHPAEISGVNLYAGYEVYEWVSYEPSPEIIELWNDGTFDGEEIGKTVFLTPEAAQKALKGEI